MYDKFVCNSEKLPGAIKYLENDGVDVKTGKRHGLLRKDLPHENPERKDVASRRGEGVLPELRRHKSGRAFDERNLFGEGDGVLVEHI